jgi:hypothetical protein
VIRPRTLKELFRLEELLIFLNLPSKCGIERRSYTPPPVKGERYGGYIYSTSMEQGLERLGILRQYLEDDDLLNGVEAYLKRACTEMEMTFPDSTTWEVTDEQNKIEDLLDWLVVYDICASLPAKHTIDKVHMVWIEWACENGDETYLEYTDGKPIYRPAVRYEPGVEGTDEDTPDDETVSAGRSSPSVPKGSTRKKTKGKSKK